MVDTKVLPGRFRLLQGHHSVKVITGTNEARMPMRELKTFCADGSKFGSVVVSGVDLELIHNGVGSRKKKFEYLGPATAKQISEELSESEKSSPSSSQPWQMDLDKMNLNDLKTLADSTGVELDGANRKADIVFKIREHRKSLLDEGEQDPE